MIRNIYITIAVLVLILMPAVEAAPAPCKSTFAVCSSGFTNWLPILISAAAVIISLTVLYYFAGVILNNSRIKASALNEIQQALGTILLIVIIIGVMDLIGSGTGLAYQSLLSGGPSSVSSGISNICTNILPNSQVGFLNPTVTSANYPQPYPNLPEATNAVCKIVTGTPTGSASGLDPTTVNLDYGLAATYIITANLTNQSIEELNALYNFESLTFFLRGVISYASICEPVWCAIPLVPRIQESTLSYRLYNGYVIHRTIMPTVITQANMSIYLFMSELMIIIILLLTWPYLLAAGILLRVFTVTRRAGGLLIAGVIVGTIIYPTLFLFQYAALNNLAPLGSTGAPAPGQAVALGASSIPAVSLCGVAMTTPVISTETYPAGSLPGTPDPFTTQYELYCYTSSNELQINNIYKGVRPLCDTTQTPPVGPGCATAAANSNCGLDFPGWTGSSDIICACSPPVSIFTSVSDPPMTQVPTCYVKKDLSFYTFPSEADVVRLYECYAPDYANNKYYADSGTGPSGMIAIEASLINAINVQSPLKVLLTLSTVLSQIAGITTPQGISPISGETGSLCDRVAPDNLISVLIATINLYGIISVVRFVLPIINVLMLISAVFGLSSLLGGETTILGLSRFI